MTERHIQEAKAAPPSCLPRAVKRQVREGRPARGKEEDNAPVWFGRKSEGVPADIARTGFGEEATKTAAAQFYVYSSYSRCSLKFRSRASIPSPKGMAMKPNHTAAIVNNCSREREARRLKSRRPQWPTRKTRAVFMIRRPLSHAWLNASVMDHWPAISKESMHVR